MYMEVLAYEDPPASALACMHAHTYTHTDIATHTLGSGIKTVLPDWQHCKLDVYN